MPAKKKPAATTKAKETESKPKPKPITKPKANKANTSIITVSIKEATELKYGTPIKVLGEINKEKFGKPIKGLIFSIEHNLLQHGYTTEPKPVDVETLDIENVEIILNNNDKYNRPLHIKEGAAIANIYLEY